MIEYYWIYIKASILLYNVVFVFSEQKLNAVAEIEQRLEEAQELVNIYLSKTGY